MNFLFIGPYRQSNIQGCSSAAILDHLINQNKNITARPIYIDECQNINKVYKSELNLYKKYDGIIQNVPLEAAIHIPNIKNYIVPIGDNKNIDKKYLNVLDKAEKILVDNVFDYRQFAEYFPDKTFYFDYSVPDPKIEISRLDTGIYNHMQKMYFIGSYKKNSDLIKTLIMCFVAISRYRENLCFIGFLTDRDNFTIETLKEFSDSVYNSFRMGSIINKTVFLNTDYDINNLNICHKTCDVFIDLNEDCKSSFNRKCAEKFDNEIVNSSNINFYADISRNGEINENQFMVPIQMSMIKEIERALNREPIDQTIEKTPIEKLICN